MTTPISSRRWPPNPSSYWRKNVTTLMFVGRPKSYQRLKRDLHLAGRTGQRSTATSAPQNTAIRKRIAKRCIGSSIERLAAGWLNRNQRFQKEKDETLQCTPHGQVAEWKPRTVFSFTQAKSRELAKKRTALRGDSLQAAVAETLKLPSPTTVVPDYRILRPSGRNYPKPHSTTYAVETEPGIVAVVTRLADNGSTSPDLPHGAPRAVLYVAHHSSDEELRDEPLVRELLGNESESEFYAVDVRGIGESRPDTCGAEMFTKSYGSDYFYAAHSIMLDRPYVGQKTLDVLRVLTWMASHGHRRNPHCGIGDGGRFPRLSRRFYRATWGASDVERRRSRRTQRSRKTRSIRGPCRRWFPTFFLNLGPAGLLCRVGEEQAVASFLRRDASGRCSFLRISEVFETSEICSLRINPQNFGFANHRRTSTSIYDRTRG